MRMLMKAAITIILLFGGSLIFFNLEQSPRQAQASEENETKREPLIPDQPLELTIQLKRVYLDGEESEETVKETIWALEDFWAKYESWQLVDMNEERLIFEKKVNDISPLLKLNGYFGITEDGTLSIFNGKPEESDIIQSFFQIDVKKLKSHQQDQLKQGIPVKTKEDFVEVFETMKKYSIEKAQ